MTQHIDTIPIITLYPKYITEKITEKTGLFQNKTKTVEINDPLDYDSMKGYPKYVLERMRKSFRYNYFVGEKMTDSVISVQYTLEQFIKQHFFCKIVSVVKYDDTICIVWRDEA